jgi:hypothetical protein
MKLYRSALVTLAICIFLVGFAQPSEAQNFLGNFCWKLDPFPDTLRVAVTSYPDGIYGINVRWRSSSYQFMGAGAISANPTNGNTLQMAFNSGGNTANLSCNFQADLNPGSLTGPWSFQCPSSGFSNSGTLSRLVPCPSDAEPFGDEDSGPTAMGTAQEK